MKAITTDSNVSLIDSSSFGRLEGGLLGGSGPRFRVRRPVGDEGEQNELTSPRSRQRRKHLMLVRLHLVLPVVEADNSYMMRMSGQKAASPAAIIAFFCCVSVPPPHRLVQLHR